MSKYTQLLYFLIVFCCLQPTQRASPSTSWWASVSVCSWRSASWWPALPAGLGATAADLPLPPRGDSWRSPARKRRMRRGRALRRKMGRRQRSPKWQWGPWAITAVSPTVPWGVWMCSLQLRSWRRQDVWRRGNGSSGRSGGTGSRTSWSQGRGLLDECITTNCAWKDKSQSVCIEFYKQVWKFTSQGGSNKEDRISPTLQSPANLSV